VHQKALNQLYTWQKSPYRHTTNDQPYPLAGSSFRTNHRCGESHLIMPQPLRDHQDGNPAVTLTRTDTSKKHDIMQQSSLPEDISPVAEAYVWGYPLLSVHRTRLHLCSKTPTATINHIDDLATPKDRAIVVPNNDTLYSSAWYDLRHGDLSIEVPPMDHPARYWNVMILDAYTHVAYICRRHHGVNGTQVRVTYDPTTPPTNDDSLVVPIGTPTAWVIMRVLVESPQDLDRARGLQRAIKVTSPSTHPKVLTERAGRATAIAKGGAEIFTEMRRFVALDPPATWHTQPSAAARAVIDNPSNVSVNEVQAGIKEGERLVAGRNLNGTVRQNGWATGRDATGFGSDVLKRAAGAKFGLGGHQAIENRSYTAEGDENGKALDGDRWLQLTFAADNMPPNNAFWSLTAYGTDMYLVENEIDRWSISDRTPGLIYGDDGSLTIDVCAQKPTHTNNWLPVPKGRYLLGMRVYEGRQEVIECRWFPPALENQGS